MLHDTAIWKYASTFSLNANTAILTQVQLHPLLIVAIFCSYSQLTYINTGLFEMTVWVLTTCHTQYTWDRGICIFLFNRTTLQVFVIYLIGALYMHTLWFYKHQHNNRVHSKLFVACQRWWFQWRFWYLTGALYVHPLWFYKHQHDNRVYYKLFAACQQWWFQWRFWYLTGALYVYPLWFYKHQHDNQIRSKLFVACQRWWFQWRFWFIVPGYLREVEEHKPDPWHNPIERNHMGLHLENKVASCWNPDNHFE
jgi:hypothetical protein